MPDRSASDFATAANAAFRSRPSCGFVCWNASEVDRILEVARSLENGCIIIGKRKERRQKRLFGSADPVFGINQEIFTDAQVPVVVWPRDRMRKFDGFFDVIVCQTPLFGSEKMTKSRVITIPDGGDCRLLVESTMNSFSRE